MRGEKRHQPHPDAQLPPHSWHVIRFDCSGGGMHTFKADVTATNGDVQYPEALLCELLVRGVEKTALKLHLNVSKNPYRQAQ